MGFPAENGHSCPPNSPNTKWAPKRKVSPKRVDPTQKAQQTITDSNTGLKTKSESPNGLILHGVNSHLIPSKVVRLWTWKQDKTSQVLLVTPVIATKFSSHPPFIRSSSDRRSIVFSTMVWFWIICWVSHFKTLLYVYICIYIYILCIYNVIQYYVVSQIVISHSDEPTENICHFSELRSREHRII